MSRFWNNDVQFNQLSVAELKSKADASVYKANEKGRKYEPITVSGKKICQSWWGQMWCWNLERYADYASRLDRGKRYVRSGTVVDLKIAASKIEARVQGSRKTPYKVEIRISPLSEEKIQSIIAKCGSKISNLESLALGSFPDDLKELFTEDNGLFPMPQEISFNCSCPDWALMCKHVAAVMYGVGVRLDENPFWFFTLRGVNVDRFIDVTIKNKVESLLANSQNKTERMLDENSVSELFGVL